MEYHWTIEVLQAYIDNQVEENLNLDYKAADALQKSDGKKKEIAKDVSAMANAAGGIIIYGIREYTEKNKKYLPEKLDPVERREISKEWLEQVINTNVQPKVAGIVITAIAANEKEDKAFYIVEIPQSNTAHQASDKNFTSDIILKVLQWRIMRSEIS